MSKKKYSTTSKGDHIHRHRYGNWFSLRWIGRDLDWQPGYLRGRNHGAWISDWLGYR
jgi:hypothetical protein